MQILEIYIHTIIYIHIQSYTYIYNFFHHHHHPPPTPPTPQGGGGVLIHSYTYIYNFFHHHHHHPPPPTPPTPQGGGGVHHHPPPPTTTHTTGGEGGYWGATIQTHNHGGGGGGGYLAMLAHIFISYVYCLFVFALGFILNPSSRDVMRMLKHVDLRYRRKCLSLTELVRRTFWRWMFLRDIIWASYKNNFMREIPLQNALGSSCWIKRAYSLTIYHDIHVSFWYLHLHRPSRWGRLSATHGETGKENATERGWHTNCFICLWSILISRPLMHHLFVVFFGIIEWPTLKA